VEWLIKLTLVYGQDLEARTSQHWQYASGIARVGPCESCSVKLDVQERLVNVVSLKVSSFERIAKKDETFKMSLARKERDTRSY